MESLLLLLVLVILLTPLEGLSTAVLTIHSPDGDLIDCILREEQPAFGNPLLKHHKLQKTPSNMPDMGFVRREEKYRWQLWHRNGTECPHGTIPVRRISSSPNETKGSNAADRATKGHEYAVGVMHSRPNIYGTQASMNVWRPRIEGIDEFSLGQIWLTSGSYNSNDINTIEAGWQVYPKLYLDYRPRFFIYWTADAYNQTGCYNLRCGGFVQTSRTIAVEGAVDQTSTFGGSQVEMTIKMWKDQKVGVWWLGVILEGGLLEPVGYWPEFLFAGLRDHAESVQWGGEIINKNTSGRHTATEMGSGYFPDSGFGKAAYMRNLQIALSENDFRPLQVQDLYVGGHQRDYYRAKKSDNPKLGTHFYYGGPRQLAIAVRLTWDSSLLYICFSLFLFI